VDIRLSGAIDGVETAGQVILRCAIHVIFLSSYLDDRTLQRVKEMDQAIRWRNESASRRWRQRSTQLSRKPAGEIPPETHRELRGSELHSH
jgi:hypothetical protein